jgi:metal-responsive CopG/Arc/MetJ family transcriptional regulator
VFLDAAYDRSSPVFKAMVGKSPLKDIPIPGADDDHYSIEEYIASIRKCYPYWAAIWGELIEEEILHAVKTTLEEKIVDKMSDAIEQAFRDTLSSYRPENSKIQAPVLSIYAILNGEDALADYMTEEQKAVVREFFDTIRPPLTRECIEQFRRDVRHARIIEIPKGHHHCFIKQEELVFDEMRKFLEE